MPEAPSASPVHSPEVAADDVVLLDDLGRASGTAARSSVHTDRTPLHLAFSCYVFDAKFRLLLTRRAQGKPTWPGVWTNSFCGHPRPGEGLEEAVRRRAQQELGLRLDELMLVLPSFRYEATMRSGLRENEMCPVFVAVATMTPTPAPAEVEEVAWVPWDDVRLQVASGTRAVSPWCRMQVAELAGREDPTGGFVEASWSQLPPAAIQPDPSGPTVIARRA